MKKIRDKRHRVACKGDPRTGRLVCIYGEYCVALTLAPGQTAAIQRDECVTLVTRTEDDFIVYAMKVA